MKNVVSLLVIGLMLFSCKSEVAQTTDAEKEVKDVKQQEQQLDQQEPETPEANQTKIAIYDVLNQDELIDVIKNSPNYSEDNEIGKDLIVAVQRNNAEIEREDSAKIAEYITSLNIDKSLNFTILPSAENAPCRLLMYKSDPLIEEEKSLYIEINQNQEYEAQFEFSDAEKWERITAANINEQLAIAVNGVILSAPTVNVPIYEGKCMVISPLLKDLVK